MKRPRAVAARAKRCVLVIGCLRTFHRQRSVGNIGDLLNGRYGLDIVKNSWPPPYLASFESASLARIIRAGSASVLNQCFRKNSTTARATRSFLSEKVSAPALSPGTSSESGYEKLM